MPRSPSPDLKHSKPYKEEVDPSQGPAKYSPNKDFVLVENPKWTILQRRSREGPPENTGGFEFDGKPQERVIGYTWHQSKEGLNPAAGSADLGPGAYDPDKANGQTKVRSYEAFIGQDRSPNREV